MRQLTFVLPALILAACGGNPPEQAENASGNTAAQEDRYVVRAGPVADARIRALSGTFQLLKSGAPEAIPSTGFGGACLAFPAEDLGFTEMAGKVCSKNSDCSSKENEYGYCDGQTQKCWSRPAGAAGEPYCNRPLQMAANELNSAPKQPVDARQAIEPGAKVRVIACLNEGGPPWQNPPPPCGRKDSDDRIEVMGPVATVR